MKVGYKVWLDHNGKAFGDGPYELLKHVERTKSLYKAANEMAMSYSKAWGLIQILGKRLDFHLLEKKVGGQSGGGSYLTPMGKNLMDQYQRYWSEVEKGIKKTYQKHFCSLPQLIREGRSKERK